MYSFTSSTIPPGGRGNLRIVPSVSLHAVKGSEWIMWEWYWEAAHSQLFPRGTPWPVDWRNYLFHSWLYAGFGGAGRASGLMFHCHLTFILKVCQTHATCTNPTELDFVIHRENWLETLRERENPVIVLMTKDKQKLNFITNGKTQTLNCVGN